MSFTAYVTVVRMEAAATALRTTEEKTYLIARKCGYDDPNYFSYVFKRHFGVTPTKYRAGRLSAGADDVSERRSPRAWTVSADGGRNSTAAAASRAFCRCPSPLWRWWA